MSGAAPAASPKVPKLPRGSWEPNNHAALQGFLAWLSTRSQPMTCAFDWDNTSVFGDVGDASLAWQLETLMLRISPAELKAVWQPVVEAASKLPSNTGHVAKQALARAEPLLADILESYTLLYAKLAADNFEASGAKQRYPQAHHRFRAKTLALCQLLADHPKPDVVGASFAAVAAMWGGLLPSDISGSVPAMMAWNDGSNRPSHWFSGEGGKAGSQRVAVPGVVRPLADMQALQGALMAAGCEVLIVSASPELIVRGAVSHFRYGIPSDNIVGIRLAEQAREGRGKKTLPQVAEGTPITYRAGKVQALEARAKSPPLLVAGDAMTDYEMLTGFSATKIRLLMHRPPLASELAALAGGAWSEGSAPDFGKPGATVLLQGRDNARRSLAPSRQSR